MSPIRQRRPVRRGFSILEAAFVTMIAGIVTVSMMQLLTAGTFANRETSELTTAVNLADNIHEATMTRTFDEIIALNGTVYSPPVDSRLSAILEIGSAWKQTVSIAYVTPANITTTSGTATDTARVTVTISRNNAVVHSISWIAGRY